MDDGVPGSGYAPAFALGSLLLRHFGAALARFGQADRDRLLAALDLLAGAAAAQRAGLALLHRAAHLLRRAFPIFSLLRLPGHVVLPARRGCASTRLELGMQPKVHF